MLVEDHLHIRGEHHDLSEPMDAALGSPPHTWRTRYAEHGFSVIPRITSTYVENTWMLMKKLMLGQDHLHIRGEHGVSCNSSAYATGSPPHTWRTPSRVGNPNAALGITSTYVENTCKDP